MINTGMRLEAILTQLQAETPYAGASILKVTLREVRAWQRQQSLAGINMIFFWQNKNAKRLKQEQVALCLA